MERERRKRERKREEAQERRAEADAFPAQPASQRGGRVANPGTACLSLRGFATHQ